MVYYRIKQVDFDGKFDYSKILGTNGSNEVSAYYNSASNQLKLVFNNLKLMEAALFSVNGQLIYQSYLPSENHKSILLQSNGIRYIVVNLVFENGRVYRKKILLD